MDVSRKTRAEGFVIGTDHIVDRTALARLAELGGDVLVLKMIDLFLTHAEPKVAVLRSNLAERNVKEVERLAHSVRSSAGNLGAHELWELAGDVEQLAAAEVERIASEVDSGTTECRSETCRANSAINIGRLDSAITEMEEAFAKVKARLEAERKERAS